MQWKWFSPEFLPESIWALHFTPKWHLSDTYTATSFPFDFPFYISSRMSVAVAAWTYQREEYVRVSVQFPIWSYSDSDSVR